MFVFVWKPPTAKIIYNFFFFNSVSQDLSTILSKEFKKILIENGMKNDKEIGKQVK